MDLTVWTIETGIKLVALWLVIWPINWKIPIGKVVLIINLVGVKKLLICKLFGTNPFGNFWIKSVLNFKTVNNVKHKIEDNENWNCVKVIGYLKLFKINLVEFDDIIEQKYQSKQNEVILISIGGNQLKNLELDKDRGGTIRSGDVGLLNGDNG